MSISTGRPIHLKAASSVFWPIYRNTALDAFSIPSIKLQIFLITSMTSGMQTIFRDLPSSEARTV
jgi:hypothetical protein